jgi:fumarate hydratase class I
MAAHELTLPLDEAAVRRLHVGDAVQLSGVLVTGRDTAHRYIVEHLLGGPEGADAALEAALRRRLAGGMIYHCGPVVERGPEGAWTFVAAGPTSSVRQERYMPPIIAHYTLRGIIGKGGMGKTTLRALADQGAVYLHAVGGAASLIARSVVEVLGVHKLETFGVPEALWVIRVADFPAVVTMDSHGRSLHDEVEATSCEALYQILEGP